MVAGGHRDGHAGKVGGSDLDGQARPAGHSLFRARRGRKYMYM